jgi:hypothetical protein
LNLSTTTPSELYERRSHTACNDRVVSCSSPLTGFGVRQVYYQIICSTPAL